ncbi:hypothetical protein NBRC116188_20790 [Oceaniserpentilla sp. 4NH20-0058]|uniref:VWA domain-containing protein n=1 Tax=Oceaniserpentilla sp. 4NH20-0058 TaxID=3127660 RepID=UPI003103D7A1
MIYPFRQPLMIVGLFLTLSYINVVIANTAGSASIDTQIDGLTLPESAQSTIIPTNKATDIRVLVDISGSMKQNDPENLRIPALNLIVEMIPQGARAGVWTFGQWVNMLIPPATVDDAWRKNAKNSAQKINSYGLRTNIGEAMEKATWLLETQGDYEQHAILLTDGLVDIADDSDPQKQKKNEQERQRISTEILKRYEELGVKIHSIGLSKNADKVLLDKLALATDGTSVVVSSAQELVKAFLKAFEKAAPEVAEQVPLSSDNTFEIDSSVEEFTALVFRKAGSNPMQLKTPDGKVISQIKGAENARWFGEAVYDLVTVTNPQPGKWEVDAELDPDNRITVVSDLKMDIANLPNALFPGQQIDFEVYLHEKGKVITNPDFLKLMTIEMTMTAESGRSGTKVISDPSSPPNDGRYKESISRLSQEGQYELKIEVDGKTFKRMRKDYIQVRQPIGFEIRKSQTAKNQAYAVRVIPQVADIEVSRTRVIAKLKGPDQSSIIQAMPWIEEGVWEAIIEPSKGPGEYEIAINIKGKMGEDQEFRVKPDPIKLQFPISDDFTHKYLTQHNEQEIKPESPEEADTQQDAVVDEAEQEEKATESIEPEEQPAEPVMPDLANKIDQQPELNAPEIVAPKGEEDVLTDEQKAALEPIPYWLYAAIPISMLVFGVVGFLIYRKLTSKKQAAAAQPEPETKESTADVSLNDGLDDEDFDEDFDLSGDDDEEMPIAIGGDDLGDDDGTSEEPEPLPELDDLDDSDMDDLEPAPIAEPVADDIPDFDENFDIENTDVKEKIESTDDTASAIDELDSVLDNLSDEDEENIPQLDEAVGDEFDIGSEAEPLDPAENDVESNAEADIDLPVNEDEQEGDNAIDEALANLESELDDIDVDALMDDDKKEE